MNAKDQKTLSGNLLISIWIAFIIALTLIVALGIFSTIGNFDIRENEAMEIWDNSSHVNENKSHTDVLTGLYLNRIPKISMKDSSFDMDLYIWFKWRGNNVSPGQNFEIVNGEIRTKDKQAEWESGDEHYEQYHVIASMNKYFDMQRFPLDSQNITVEIEDGLNSIDELSYIPDTSKDCNMSSQIIVPGYDTKWIIPLTRIHNYETNFASPWTNTSASTYSQIIFGVSLSHLGWGFYFKLSQALFVSVFVAILCFFLRPDYSPRFVVGVGSLFADVAAYYFILSIQPPVSYLTVADIIYFISIITIFLTLVQSAISFYMHDHKVYRRLYRRFDIYSAVIFASCFIFINLWIIWVATHH